MMDETNPETTPVTPEEETAEVVAAPEETPAAPEEEQTA